MSGIYQTCSLSSYLRALFVSEMGGKGNLLKLPTTLSLEFLEECHFAVRLVTRAIKNLSELLSNSLQ